jgi:nucleoside-diphosphate-sugar epimerase
VVAVTSALVTGGAGAIGSNLTRALLARGYDVTILDDLSSGRAEFVPSSARFVRGSVENPDDIERAMEAEPEVVVHLAALFANQNSVEHPERDLLVNGLGTVHVFEAARRHGVRKILNCSSSCVYGDREVMRESDDIGELDTPYAITKLLGEQYASFWVRHHGLDVVSVRLFNVYGPFERPGRYRNVIPNFVATALRGEPLRITGTGDETRDFTFVDDTVAGLLLVLERDTTPGDLFNLASGRETPIRRLAELVNEVTGNTAGITYTPRRTWDRVSRRCGDITLARGFLGYSPSVTLEEGLERTVKWLRDDLAARPDTPR